MKEGGIGEDARRGGAIAPFIRSLHPLVLSMIGLLCIERESNCLAKPILRSMTHKDCIDEPKEFG